MLYFDYTDLLLSFMYPEYFYWQYVLAPRWLLMFFWHVQQSILQFFSVPLMLRTLFSHWHRDSVPYRGGPISLYINTFLLNMISRVLGFIIRLILLAVWMVTEAIFLLMSGAVLAACILAPLGILAAFAWGLTVLLGTL